MRGITVVAASLPAFAEADVIMNGTPIPLAIPTNAEPMRIPAAPPTMPRKTYDTINKTGAMKRAPFLMHLLRDENASPPTKPNTSIMAITGAMRPCEIAPDLLHSSAKLAGYTKNVKLSTNMTSMYGAYCFADAPEFEDCLLS